MSLENLRVRHNDKNSRSVRMFIKFLIKRPFFNKLFKIIKRIYSIEFKKTILIFKPFLVFK
jgi:hypothetical protein